MSRAGPSHDRSYSEDDWAGFRPTSVAVTTDGIAVVMRDGGSSGSLFFLPYEKRRDIAPCRRVTFRLVIPEP